VVKHPRVQCQLTIVSSSKVSKRDALNLIYRALSLEGFATIESSNAILIVPEGQEPKMSPELMAPAAGEIPEGRQRLMKVFQVQHLTASEITERLKGVLSEQGTLEADDRGNRIIATDYTENIRLLAELIPQLDLASPSDSDIRIYALKFAEAEQLAGLLTLVLNERPAPPSSAPSRSSSSRSSRPTVMMPGMPPPSSPTSSGPAPSTATGDEQVRFWPDSTSNRLIVSAPRSRIPEIEELIRVLDAQKPADVAIRVLPLKHVNAVDLIADIAPLYQKMSGRSLKDMIEVSANDLSNSLIVLSSEANFKAIEELVHTLDTPDAQDKIVRTFPLRNADAEDVAEQSSRETLK
jgi:type II secretory pathway component GspD/PulD (secretin)